MGAETAPFTYNAKEGQYHQVSMIKLPVLVKRHTVDFKSFYLGEGSRRVRLSRASIFAGFVGTLFLSTLSQPEVDGIYQ